MIHINNVMQYIVLFCKFLVIFVAMLATYSIDKKLRAMEETLMKGMQIEYDCSAVVRKLLAMIHSANKEIRALRQMTTYLIQVTAKTMPRGLHCLPLRLTAEYFSKSFGEQQQQPSNVYPERTDDPNLYHYALFSDNILATAVVVNSTVSNAKVLFIPYHKSLVRLHR